MIELFKIFLNQITQHKSDGASLSQLKHFFKWKKSLNEDSSSIKDEQPWITFDAIEFLKKQLTADSKVFEYGGGGSTLFFVKRAKEVFTVEHDKEWFENVKVVINNTGTQNWKGYLLKAQVGNHVPNPVISSPDSYTSDAETFREFNFLQYASKIDEFPDNYFDVVLVDGRSRPACMKHSIPKLKKGGILVLDNSDREYYLTSLSHILVRDFTKQIDNMGASPYARIFTKTSIWKKN